MAMVKPYVLGRSLAEPEDIRVDGRLDLQDWREPYHRGGQERKPEVKLPCQHARESLFSTHFGRSSWSYRAKIRFGIRVPACIAVYVGQA